MDMYGKYQDWMDKDIFDTNGDKIGSVDEVFYDETSSRPQWLVIKSGLFGTKKTIVPVSAVTTKGEDLRVSFTKDRVKDAPQIDDDQVLSDSDEQRLYTYYNLDWKTSSADYTGTGMRTTRPSQLTRSRRTSTG